MAGSTPRTKLTIRNWGKELLCSSFSLTAFCPSKVRKSFRGMMAIGSMIAHRIKMVFWGFEKFVLKSLMNSFMQIQEDSPNINSVPIAWYRSG